MRLRKLENDVIEIVKNECCFLEISYYNVSKIG